MGELYYDIVNISKDRWEGPVKVHLSAGALGYEYASIPVGGTLENIPASKLTDRIKLLAKEKRGRPPVLKVVEVDYEARMDKQKQADDLQIARGLKKMEARAALAKDEASKAAAKPAHDKKSKKDVKLDLTAAEAKALEFGKDLP